MHKITVLCLTKCVLSDETIFKKYKHIIFIVLRTKCLNGNLLTINSFLSCCFCRFQRYNDVTQHKASTAEWRPLPLVLGYGQQTMQPSTTRSFCKAMQLGEQIGFTDLSYTRVYRHRFKIRQSARLLISLVPMQGLLEIKCPDSNQSHILTSWFWETIRKD